MKKFNLFVAIAGTVMLAGAEVPVVSPSGVTLSSDGGAGAIIGYTLSGGPAVITVDIQTNASAQADGDWVSIGAENQKLMCGDVNRRIEPGIREIHWAMMSAWPGHRIDAGIRAVVTAWPNACPPDYMVVDLTVPSNVWYYASKDALPEAVTSVTYKTRQLVMRKIPAAGVKWVAGREGAKTVEGEYAAHYVTLTNDYYIGVFELTQQQYRDASGDHDNVYSDRLGRIPVVGDFSAFRGSYKSGYNWPTNGHAVKADSLLGKLRALTGLQFDFPTAAQWEFAARAGTGTELYGTKTEIAWDVSNWKKDPDLTANARHEVGLLKPNAFGLYDILGNAYEYCLDWMSQSEAAASSGTDVIEPVGPDTREPMTAASGCDRGGGGRTWAGGSYDGESWSYKPSATYRYTWAAETGTANSTGVRLWCPIK